MRKRKVKNKVQTDQIDKINNKTVFDDWLENVWDVHGTMDTRRSYKNWDDFFLLYI